MIAVNRLLGNWSANQFRIFGTKIEQFSLTTGTQSYSIGVGADFNTALPLAIIGANCVYPTDPQIFIQLRVMSDRDWSQLTMRKFSAAPIYAVYLDRQDTQNPTQEWGRIYLLGQPPNTYKLELFTPYQFKTSFTSVSDNFAMPAGFEQALVDGLALEIVELYPLEAKMSATTRTSCLASIRDVEILNASMPRLRNDARRVGGSLGVPVSSKIWDAWPWW
jgi:hypothetical protein